MKKSICLLTTLIAFTFLASCNKAKELTSLCFTAIEEDSKIAYCIKGDQLDIDIETSLDDKTWVDWAVKSPITLKKDQKLYIRNTTKTLTINDDNYFKFTTEKGKFTTSGNVMSMINYAKLSENCFNGLFDSCNITTSPSLPATTLVNRCYEKMFINCALLTKAPNLPSLTLKRNCYYRMFEGCKNLKIYEDYSGFKHQGTKFFVCPSLLGLDISVIDMFKGTSGEYRDTPTEGHAYYWYL